MSDDQPIDAEALLAMVAEMTVWASPGLVVDDFHPGLGALPLLSVVHSFTVHTSDSRVGAEIVDVVLSSLLGQGPPDHVGNGVARP